MKDSIDPEITRRVGRLAKIALTDEEAQKLSKDLSGVLEYFEQIKGVDTSGVEPLGQPHQLETPLREDKAVIFSENADRLTAKAPEEVGGEYKVPPIL